MIHRSSISALVLLPLLLLSPPALARGGLYFGFDLGGALVYGDRDIPLRFDETCQCLSPWGGPASGDTVRTDTGSGFAAGLKLGYNVMGYGSLEAGVLAHGNKMSVGDTWEGAGHAAAILRLYPLQFTALFGKLATRKPESLPDGASWTAAMFKRKYDVNLYFGYGFFNMTGYHYNPEDGAGWEGTDFEFGLGADYKVIKTVSLGVDLKFIKSSYDKFLCKFDPEAKAYPEGAVSTWTVAPTATITFHLFDPHR
ncbi:MAG: hypothetical protein FJ109_00675 [Deltaproteobacteria bacterium]|nr:hypothetical protein [Deltaproteobacteria bacterium]